MDPSEVGNPSSIPRGKFGNCHRCDCPFHAPRSAQNHVCIHEVHCEGRPTPSVPSTTPDGDDLSTARDEQQLSATAYESFDPNRDFVRIVTHGRFPTPYVDALIELINKLDSEQKVSSFRPKFMHPHAYFIPRTPPCSLPSATAVPFTSTGTNSSSRKTMNGSW